MLDVFHKICIGQAQRKMSCFVFVKIFELCKYTTYKNVKMRLEFSKIHRKEIAYFDHLCEQ